jgi:hypothetical protein
MDETATPQSVLNKVSVDKFLLVLNLPPILKTIDNRSSRDKNKVNLDSIQFSVEGSIVPEISIPNITIPFAGQNLEVTSYSREAYQKNNINFTIDNRFNNYWILWKWLNILNDSKIGLFNQDNLPDPSVIASLHNYQTDMSIFSLDEYNNKIMEFKYHKAFITKLGGIQYHYQQSNQIVSSFEFAYSQLHLEML